MPSRIALFIFAVVLAIAATYGPTGPSAPVTVSSTSWQNVVSVPFNVGSDYTESCNEFICVPVPNVQLHADIYFPNQGTLKYQVLVGTTPAQTTTAAQGNGHLYVDGNVALNAGSYTAKLRAAKKSSGSANVTITPASGHVATLAITAP